ncbi:MAG: tripartite tricarboxylate transporter substrate binding protein [Alphaproteobacteria bacterium]|nr:tripartite tricarboxylate transporter substrate binding protein [Alphaproteobacteria bacterium]
MNLIRRRLLATLAAAPLSALLPRAALAAFPDRGIKFVVPFAAGGNADLVGRLLAEGMGPTLGQSIVVENRAGAGGSLGAGVVASSPPDGYTLLIGSNGPLTVNPFVQAKLSYDSLKDFVAIGLANLAPHTLVLHPSIPAKTVPELVALSKKQQLSIATSGAGSAGHLTLVRFIAATGANLTHVPYRGGATLVPDMIAGNVSGGMTEMSTALPQHKGGKLRIFAVASARRPALAPEAPTMIDLGLKDFLAASYVGLLAPAKTPPDVVAALEKALIKAVAAKSLQDKFLATGAELVPENLQNSKGFGEYIRREFENAREAAKLAGLKPQ